MDVAWRVARLAVVLVLALVVAACGHQARQRNAAAMPGAPVRGTGSPARSDAPSSSSSTARIAGPGVRAGNGPTANVPAGANPARIEVSAWLPADQVPMSQKYAWKWYTQLPAASTGTIGYGGVDVACGQPTLDSLGAVGAAGQMAHAPQTGANDWSINQRLYFFPDRDRAAAAFAMLAADVEKCASGGSVTSPGIHATARGDHTFGWAQYPVPTSAPNLTRYENHSFLTQRGAVISIFTAATASGSGNPSTDYNPTGDSAVATTIAAHLSTYGGAG